MDIKLEYGLMPPDNVSAIAAWGARAIYVYNMGTAAANYTKAGTVRKRGRVPNYTVDLLGDRQDRIGDPAALKALGAWLDKVALPRLRQEINLLTSSDETHSITEGNFTLRASPRSSYGYLYIGAWVVTA